ncbi:MAG: sigma-70 family RNA polymerase sigma factor [Planctomycetota bacterium]
MSNEFDKRDGRFLTTCWSQVVMAARNGSQWKTSSGHAALHDLCERYWYPLYGFARRSGQNAENAQDLVQGFFAHLLEKDRLLQSANPQQGKFRSFLLTAFQNYIRNQHRRDTAQRRGGGATILSLQWDDGEQQYEATPVDEMTPQRLFERSWALSVIDAALSRVERQHVTAQQQKRFAALRPLLAPAGDPPSQADVAQQIGCNVNAVKVALHRLRAKMAEAIQDEVAETLASENGPPDKSSIQAEVAHLMQALA